MLLCCSAIDAMFAFGLSQICEDLGRAKGAVWRHFTTTTSSTATSTTVAIVFKGPLTIQLAQW